MPQVHDIGKKHFLQFMKYPTRKFPFLDLGSTYEIEEPYRSGESLVFRVPLTRRAVVVGRWVGVMSEDQALRTAIRMRELDVV